MVPGTLCSFSVLLNCPHTRGSQLALPACSGPPSWLQGLPSWLQGPPSLLGDPPSWLKGPSCWLQGLPAGTEALSVGSGALPAGSRALPASFKPLLALLGTIGHCTLRGCSQITSFNEATEAEGTADHVKLLRLRATYAVTQPCFFYHSHPFHFLERRLSHLKQITLYLPDQRSEEQKPGLRD